MTYSIEFELPGLPKSNPADNRHWRTIQKETKQWQAEVALATLGKRPREPIQKARAVFTRCSSVEPDSDNLAYSFKRIRDALLPKHSGIIVDDKPANLEAEYRWEKAKPKHGRVRVYIEAVDADR